MRHELKIWPQYYARVADGSKTFEVRKNDRNFQMGDTVELRYFDPEFLPSVLFTEDEIQKMHDQKYPRLTFKIGFILPQENGTVVFSLLPLEQSK